MSFIEQIEIDTLKGKLSNEVTTLGKIYKAKKNKFQTRSVVHSLVEDLLKEGWEVDGKPLASKTKLKKLKDTATLFEDDVWCQFYELGFRYLNYDENFILPFSKEKNDKKQIDVAAIDIDKEIVFLIECKSSETVRKESFKDEFDLLWLRLEGFKKVIEQAFGRGMKVKYILATRNLRIDEQSVDFERLKKTGSFYYNDNTYEYINSLIKNYKKAAFYQFLGLIFKNEIINNDKIEVPAIEGKMGGKKYYMFSIEPALLLKIGFVLHRTRVNEAEYPTYQRLLIPKRLSGITKFINRGGYFPNSIIINFNQTKHKLLFEASARNEDTVSRFGILKIPNAFAIAYVIDGQHRLYGYADSDFLESNTIPVVAFDGLETKEQLDIFMEINENQKAVSPSLRTDLEEDIYWNASRADYRMKALRSSIIKGLCNTASGPLHNKITVGEDKRLLSMEYFSNGIVDSGLLPTATGNKFKEDTTKCCLYDIHNQEHEKEMNKSKKEIVEYINLCYGFVQEKYPQIFYMEKYLIISNRGSYAFVALIGSLNTFLTNQNKLGRTSSPKERFNQIEKYLTALFDNLKLVPNEEIEEILGKLGQGAEDKWLRFFQNLINTSLPDYNPKELIDWKERQDKVLQDKGRQFGINIEKFIKRKVIEKIQYLYKDNWELEINTIKRECQNRAEQEMEKNYKEGLIKREVHWTEMFNINDYKSIIEKYWVQIPNDLGKDIEFKTFQDEFSIDIGDGFNSKAERLKWISRFNSYRNIWAHEGTKEKTLNKEEVTFLELIYHHFYE